MPRKSGWWQGEQAGTVLAFSCPETGKEAFTMYGKSRLQSANLMARARTVGKAQADKDSKDPVKRARAALREKLVTKGGRKLR
ncbi:MAG: hypothetical protein AAGA69_04825 [Pseudomonadota bacterium]